MIGSVFIISGPSAVGKTTVANGLLDKQNDIKTDGYAKLSRVITCTTRAPRGNEQNHIDYNFMSKDEFLRHINQNDFAEYSEVYGNYYGVLISSITDIINSGNNALLVINWEGFLKIKSKIKNTIGFFLLPPDKNTLEQRIRSRGSDSEEIIQKRLKLNDEDFKHADSFNYQIVNNDLNQTINTIIKNINNELNK